MDWEMQAHISRTPPRSGRLVVAGVWPRARTRVEGQVRVSDWWEWAFKVRVHDICVCVIRRNNVTVTWLLVDFARVCFEFGVLLQLGPDCRASRPRAHHGSPSLRRSEAGSEQRLERPLLLLSRPASLSPPSTSRKMFHWHPPSNSFTFHHLMDYS